MSMHRRLRMVLSAAFLLAAACRPGTPAETSPRHRPAGATGIVESGPGWARLVTSRPEGAPPHELIAMVDQRGLASAPIPAVIRLLAADDFDGKGKDPPWGSPVFFSVGDFSAIVRWIEREVGRPVLMCTFSPFGGLFCTGSGALVADAARRADRECSDLVETAGVEVPLELNRSLTLGPPSVNFTPQAFGTVDFGTRGPVRVDVQYRVRRAAGDNGCSILSVVPEIVTLHGNQRSLVGLSGAGVRSAGAVPPQRIPLHPQTPVAAFVIPVLEIPVEVSVAIAAYWEGALEAQGTFAFDGSVSGPFAFEVQCDLRKQGNPCRPTGSFEAKEVVLGGLAPHGVSFQGSAWARAGGELQLRVAIASGVITNVQADLLAFVEGKGTTAAALCLVDDQGTVAASSGTFTDIDGGASVGGRIGQDLLDIPGFLSNLIPASLEVMRLHGTLVDASNPLNTQTHPMFRPMLTVQDDTNGAPHTVTARARMTACYPFTDAVEFELDWGDGTKDRFSALPGAPIPRTHTYQTAGTRTLRLKAVRDTHGTVGTLGGRLIGREVQRSHQIP